MMDGGREWIESRLQQRSLVLVHDQPQVCPYLPDQEARMPLLWPKQRLSPDELDIFLEAGYRRSGSYMYCTRCPQCRACEPSRVDVHSFCWTKSLRRVLQRGDAALQASVHPPQFDDQRLALINRHRFQRRLSLREAPLDAKDYHAFLIETCCQTQEISYWYRGALVASAIFDLGQQGISAVYCYFDPDHSRFSLGTYSILKQIQYTQQSGRRYLYLGMYVAANRHLSYKGRFLPQERLINQLWHPFSSPD